MEFNEKIINKISGIATGGRKKSIILTPIVGGIFTIVTILFLLVPLWLDAFLHLVVLITAGIFLMTWSMIYFVKGKRSPVPINPPVKLIDKGPYAFSRNPMHGGMFILMFGIGLMNGSLLSVVIFTPLYIFIDVAMLKKIEEPELEKRLGKDYLDYKKRTPMFFPKLF